MFLKRVVYYFMHGCPHCVNAEPVMERLKNHPDFKKMNCVFKKTEASQSPPHIQGFPTLTCMGQKYPGPLHSEHDILHWIKTLRGKRSTRKLKSKRRKTQKKRR